MRGGNNDIINILIIVEWDFCRTCTLDGDHDRLGVMVLYILFYLSISKGGNLKLSCEGNMQNLPRTSG